MATFLFMLRRCFLLSVWGWVSSGLLAYWLTGWLSSVWLVELIAGPLIISWVLR